MRKTLPLFTALLIAGALTSGCAKTTNKFGRGLRNTTDIVRLGEMRRSMEQSAVFEGQSYAATTGFVRGLGRSLGRTGIGIYEMVTAPFPPYDPVFTDTFAPGPVYPDNYKPGMAADPMYDTDTHVSFSGGEVAPMIPGSRFTIFDNTQ